MAVQKPGRNVLAFAILAVLCSQASAQDGRASSKEATTLDALVVSAQKREEKLQDVPIVVTTLSAQLLQDTGVRDIKDLQVLVPGLTVNSTLNDTTTTARIRGIGTVGDNPGLESAVGVVIDGVYRPRAGVGFGDLGEIERIEVLKGPQGTVYGKSTSAGVINIITRRPGYQQSAEGEITVGNYGALGVSGAYNDALSDNAAFRIYAAKRKRDGFLDVKTGIGPRTEDEDGDQNFHSLRGQLLLEPTDNLDINFIADFTSREENCCSAAAIVVGATAPLVNALAGGGPAIAAPGSDPFDRIAYSNRGTEYDVKDKGISAEVNWDTSWLGDATLTSVTASRDWQNIAGGDLDFTGADILYRNADEDESLTGFKTFTQEFRLTGSSEKLDWMAGLYYSDEDLTRHNSFRIGAGYEPFLSTLVFGGIAPAITGLGLPITNPNPAAFLSQVAGAPGGFAGLATLDRYQQNDKTSALFTNNTWHATDALDLTLGLRYTRDEKKVDSLNSNPNGSPACAAVLANPGARVAAGLLAQGVPLGALTPAQRAAVVGALAPAVVARMCLPWSNALHAVDPALHQEHEEKEWSGALKAAYRWNENWMTYASAARGYKAGGFNLDRVQSSNGLPSGGPGITPVSDTWFPGEFVDSYELGAKTTWADGNLLLNAALFHQTYEDFQFNSFLGTSYLVRSIPEVTTKGVDADMLWQTGVKGLMLQGGVTYADTRYGDDIPDVNFKAPAGALYKLPGSQLSFAPEWSVTGAMAYERDFGSDLVARFNLGARYLSSYNTGSDLDVEKEQDAYTVVNARVGFGARNNRWMVELWGMNITDAEYYQVGFDMPLQTASPKPGDPRNTYGGVLSAPATYGVTLRVQY